MTSASFVSGSAAGALAVTRSAPSPLSDAGLFSSPLGDTVIGVRPFRSPGDRRPPISMETSWARLFRCCKQAQRKTGIAHEYARAAKTPSGYLRQVLEPAQGTGR